MVRNLALSLSLAVLMIAIAGLYVSFVTNDSYFLDSKHYPLNSNCRDDGFFRYSHQAINHGFSVAFGISVDDTIHFLVKYRQELQANKWKIKKSVYLALRETGVSMFYTSIVLFFGFSVFMISSYGGTVALGGLVSATLLFAMLANLILLPSLLLSLEESIANETLKNPVLIY